MKSRWTRSAATAVMAAVVIIVGASSALAALSTTPDPSWMTNGKVYAMAQGGSTMYVGGQFTQLRSTPAGVSGPKLVLANLAAIDAATGVGMAGFDPIVTHATDAAYVRALAVSPDGTRLYLGGHFDSIDGTPVRNLAAIDLATGQLDPTFDAVNAGSAASVVLAILPDPDGSQIYLGGSFLKVGGQDRSRLAAVLADGSLEPSWTPAASAQVRSLALSSDGQTIFIAGNFTTVNGTSRQQVARVDATTGALSSWSIPSGTIPQPMVAWSVVATPTRLYGGFGKGPNFAAAFRLDNGNTGSQAWRFNTVGNVQKVILTEDASRLLIGGHFGTGRLQQSACGTYLHALAMLNPTNGSLDCSWVPQLAPYGDNYQGVWDIDLTPTHAWFGGRFSIVGGVSQQNVARVLR